MDPLTIDRIKYAHPKIRVQLQADYIECNNLLPKGVRLRFAYVYRSPEEQEKLFKQRPKVTNSRAYQSVHQYGLAFDYVILLDKDNNGTFEAIDWDINSKYHKIVIDFFIKKGYSWGGNWKSFKDYPHFQKDYGLNWHEMYNKLSKGDFIVENGIKYINI